MKAKTSKAILLGLISISFVLITFLGAAVHAATRAPDIYKIDETRFPDPIFRQYILDTIDEDKNGYLDAMERGQVTSISLNNGYNGSKIYDLTGIEYFTSITYLDVSSNELTELNLSGFSELTEIKCYGNQLTALDVTDCINLTELLCYNNALTSVDVSTATKLVTLWINNNQLTELDLSNNNITSLYCDNNQIKNLNLSGNTNLYELECRNNQLTFLDVSMATELELLYIENNKLESLDLSNNINLDMLFCSDNKLTQLDISNCTLLYGFDCSDNQLTELDVSNCIMLWYFNCDGNQLLSLDLSKNTNLTSGTQSPQTRTLSPVTSETFNLTDVDSHILGDKIENPTGATFNGTLMTGYVKGTPITYQYNTGNSNKMEVTITLDIQYSYLSFQDGNQEFNSWKQGYTAPHLYVEGTELQLPTADSIEKEGYIFAGWYDNENFTGNPIDKIDSTATGDKILYAKWEPERFTITIPKRITLSGETKSGTYTVTCTGNIKDYRYVSVIPDSSFTITQKGKESITATTVQQITKFRAEDYTGSLEADETEMGTDIEGTINTPDLTAGSWNGTFNFKINLI